MEDKRLDIDAWLGGCLNLLIGERSVVVRCLKLLILVAAVVGGTVYVVHTLESGIISWKTVVTALVVAVPFAVATFFMKHRYELDKYIEDRRNQE